MIRVYDHMIIHSGLFWALTSINTTLGRGGSLLEMQKTGFLLSAAKKLRLFKKSKFKLILKL